MKKAIEAAAFSLLLTALASCSGNYKPLIFSSSEMQAYLSQLDSFRVRKDAFFKSDLSSPLTAEQRKDFKHLNYYPPNLSLIFRVRLIKESNPENVGIQATGGETRQAIRYGEFHFEVSGKKLTLYVYKMIGDGANELFVPFTDATCGTTSYSGGRYIDLTQHSSGEYTLDFNYAYNPYCAYNHNYSCPIVPKDNSLGVEIRAGEMMY